MSKIKYLLIYPNDIIHINKIYGEFMLKLKTVLVLIFAIVSMSLLTGCIPANQHVGKPAPHSYKSGYYYDRGYYYR